MRRLALIIVLLSSCSDDERARAPSSSVDSGVAGDGSASDAAPGCFWTDGTIPTVPFRLCNKDDDCTTVEHELDCCGSIVVMGVGKTQTEAFGKCEAATRARQPECGCAAQPTKTEDGKTLASGVTPIVKCTDITDAGGICKTSLP